MAVPVWTVTVGGNTLSNVQHVSYTTGRTKITDPFRSGTATITGRVPSSLPAVNIGDEVTMSCTYNSGFIGITMRVSDLSIDYGIIPSLDTWTLTCEDAFAILGRATISTSWTAGTNCFTAAQTAAGLAGVYLEQASPTNPIKADAQTITDENCLDVVSTLAITEQALLLPVGDTIYWRGNGWQTSFVGTSANLTDAGSGSNPVKYQALNFTSLADNYAEEVYVAIRNGSTVQYGTGNYSITVSTYSLDVAQANNLAAFIAGQLDNTVAVPYQISISLNNQTNLGWQGMFVGNSVVVTFRGSTYTAVIIGLTVTGDLDNTRITANLASSAYFQFLTLDSPIFGTLDYNKLGW